MKTEMIFRLICGAVGLIMFVYYLRRERKIASLMYGAVTGLAALFLLNKYGCYIGAELPLDLFDLCGSAVLGVPFVVCLVILKFI